MKDRDNEFDVIDSEIDHDLEFDDTEIDFDELADELISDEELEMIEFDEKHKLNKDREAKKKLSDKRKNERRNQEEDSRRREEQRRYEESIRQSEQRRQEDQKRYDEQRRQDDINSELQDIQNDYSEYINPTSEYERYIEQEIYNDDYYKSIEEPIGTSEIEIQRYDSYKHVDVDPYNSKVISHENLGYNTSDSNNSFEGGGGYDSYNNSQSTDYSYIDKYIVEAERQGIHDYHERVFSEGFESLDKQRNDYYANRDKYQRSVNFGDAVISEMDKGTDFRLNSSSDKSSAFKSLDTNSGSENILKMSSRTNSTIPLGAAIFNEKTSYLKGEAVEKTLGSSIYRPEREGTRVVTSQKLGEISVDVSTPFKKVGDAASSMIRQASRGDDTLDTAYAYSPHLQTIKSAVGTAGFYGSSAVTKLSGKVAPTTAEELAKLLSEDKFKNIVNLTPNELLKEIRRNEALKHAAHSSSINIERVLKLKSQPNLEALKATRKTNLIDYNKSGIKVRNLKDMYRLKGGSGHARAIKISKQNRRTATLKRLPLTLILGAAQKGGDETLSSAARLMQQSTVPLNKVKLGAKFLGRNIHTLTKFAGKKLASTKAGSAVVNSNVGKAVRAASDKAAAAARIARRPITQGTKPVVKKAGGQVVKSISNRVNNASANSLVKRGLRLGGRARKGVAKVARKTSNTMAMRAMRQINLAIKKVAATAHSIVNIIGGIVSIGITTVVVFAAAFFIIILINSVVLMDTPERDIAHLAIRLEGKADKFTEKVMSYADRETDTLTVIVHLPEDSVELDNRREILSMTAVYFEQDFTPKGNAIFNWGDSLLGDGINNDVVRYMDALFDNSHSVTTTSEVKLEMRVKQIDLFKQDLYDSGRPLESSLLWNYDNESNKFYHEFYVRTDIKENITYENQYPEGCSAEGPNDPEDLEIDCTPEEIEIIEEYEEDVYRKDFRTILDVTEENKANGVTYILEDGEYRFKEERETEITYLNVYADVKRFDAIFDLDKAGNLYYTDKLGVYANNLYRSNLKDYSYVNTDGVIELGMYSWKGNAALDLLKEMYEGNNLEFEAAGSSYPDAWTVLENYLKASGDWSSFKVEARSDMHKLLREILITPENNALQQKKHADKVTDAIKVVKDLGITDEQSLLFLGEIVYRKGDNIFATGNYKKMMDQFLKGKHDVSQAYKSYKDFVIDDQDERTVTSIYNKVKVITDLGDKLSGGGGGWGYPFSETKTITSDFGYRNIYVEDENGNPIDASWHDGMDFGAAAGTDLYAVTSGTVVSSSFDPISGNFISVDAGNGYSWLYAHMKERSHLSVGDTVTRGDLVGFVGSTGASTGAHLHLGVKHQGRWVNPASVLDIEHADGSFGSNLGGVYNNNPDWDGWTTDNRDWVKNIYSQDWADIYGLYDKGTSGAEDKPNFKGYINPSYLSESEIDSELVDKWMKELPSNATTKQKSFARIAFNSIGRANYLKGGKATAQGLSGLESGLDESGFIQWLYWSAGYSVKSSWNDGQSIYQATREVEETKLKIGDMAFQSSNGSGRIAVYLGNNKWIQMTPGLGVSVVDGIAYTNYRTYDGF